MEPLRILLATDGSTEACTGVGFLAALALPPGTPVRIVSVAHAAAGLSPASSEARELLAFERRSCREAVREAAEVLGQAGGAVEVEVREGDPAREIVRAAEAWGAELIVVGAKDRSAAGALLLGSVSEGVARRAGRSVLVARPLRRGLRTALLAVDGSERADRAAALAARLPLPEEAEFLVAHVLGPAEVEGIAALALENDPALFPPPVQQARALLEAAGKQCRVEVRVGDAGKELLALVEESGADLVVAGTPPASALREWFLGSASGRLLNEATCSVLVVP